MNVFTLITKVVTAVVSHWVFQALFFIGLIGYALYKHKQKNREYGDY